MNPGTFLSATLSEERSAPPKRAAAKSLNKYTLFISLSTKCSTLSNGSGRWLPLLLPGKPLHRFRRLSDAAARTAAGHVRAGEDPLHGIRGGVPAHHVRLQMPGHRPGVPAKADKMHRLRRQMQDEGGRRCRRNGGRRHHGSRRFGQATRGSLELPKQRNLPSPAGNTAGPS